MFAEKKGVIVVVVMLVICSLLVCNAAPAVEAKTPTATKVTPAKTSTALTISAPSTVEVKKSFSIAGQLTSNGAPFTKQTVSLQRLGGTTWTTIASQFATTGAYSFSRTETTATTYQYRITYAGSATYVSATSPTVAVNIKPTPKPTPTPTTLTIATSNATPALNQSFTLSGTLTANGISLSGKTILLQIYDPSGNWSKKITTTTDANGAYTFTISESAQGHYLFEPSFLGDTKYTEATATVWLTVGNIQKSVFSITNTNNNPAVNQLYTVHGTLKDGVTGAPLAGQPFRFYVNGPGGAEIYSVMATTDANGAYSFRRSESAQGSYVVAIAFYGNSNYSESSDMLIVTVGNPIPSKISVGVTNNNPAVGQPFTFSGYLTDLNGRALADRTIWINVELPDGGWGMSPHTTTDSHGYFSATFSEQSAGFYHFECAFLGDAIYAETSSLVQIPVGTLISTTLTMNPSVTTPAVNQAFTLSGYLKDVNGTPLPGKLVHLDRWVAGQSATPGGIYDWAYTDQNGHYSFTLNEAASGTYQYMAVFAGDQNYAESWLWMSFTVGTLA